MPGLQGIERGRHFALSTSRHWRTKVQATGYSLSELAWMDISYISSKVVSVSRLATIAPDGKTYCFMFVGRNMEQQLLS